MDLERSPFDRLVDEGWPAPGRVAAGGWIYRHAGGVTKRANSVLPLVADGAGTGLAGAVAGAERFYAELGLRCVFSIGPGAVPGLDAELDRRGYRVADPTLIMTAASVWQAVPDGDVAPGKVAPGPSERWLRTWWRVDGGRHHGEGDVPAMEWARRIMTGVPAGYVRLETDAGAGVGRGVVQGDWLGVYCMAVEPGARRRGLGRSVLRRLLAWGRERGAERAYLVVTEGNAGARALYEREGFTVAGRYHYRVAP
ncbi:GNAT family N-acetyltransferase [Sphaerimonospora mesophila]|uniref:GNAT family N-acetyltransferase n=1 Tax=Sphaerimonospora mesophila TaxID=37483 RepID=UPI0006E3600F